MAIVLAALALSCGSDTSAAPSPSTTNEPPVVTTTATAPTTTDPPPTTATTTEPLTDEEAILAAVDGYWQSFLDANNPPDPNHPDLGKYSTGPALEVTTENILKRQELGQAVVLPANPQWNHDVGSVQIAGDTATAIDSAIDDGQLVQRSDGTVLNDAVATFLWSFDLVLIDGSWKVTSTNLEEQWDGATTCDI